LFVSTHACDFVSAAISSWFGTENVIMWHTIILVAT